MPLGNLGRSCNRLVGGSIPSVGAKIQIHQPFMHFGMASVTEQNALLEFFLDSCPGMDVCTADGEILFGGIQVVEHHRGGRLGVTAHQTTSAFKDHCTLFGPSPPIDYCQAFGFKTL